jgi:hypothetical protein
MLSQPIGAFEVITTSSLRPQHSTCPVDSSARRPVTDGNLGSVRDVLHFDVALVAEGVVAGVQRGLEQRPVDKVADTLTGHNGNNKRT